MVSGRVSGNLEGTGTRRRSRSAWEDGELKVLICQVGGTCGPHTWAGFIKLHHRHGGGGR